MSDMDFAKVDAFLEKTAEVMALIEDADPDMESKSFYIDPETKVRRVRDAAYWGMPVNTVITPGMKPVNRNAARALASRARAASTPRSVSVGGRTRPNHKRGDASSARGYRGLDTIVRGWADGYAGLGLDPNEAVAKAKQFDANNSRLNGDRSSSPASRTLAVAEMEDVIAYPSEHPMDVRRVAKATLAHFNRRPHAVWEHHDGKDVVVYAHSWYDIEPDQYGTFTIRSNRRILAEQVRGKDVLKTIENSDPEQAGKKPIKDSDRLFGNKPPVVAKPKPAPKPKASGGPITGISWRRGRSIQSTRDNQFVADYGSGGHGPNGASHHLIVQRASWEPNGPEYVVNVSEYGVQGKPLWKQSNRTFATVEDAKAYAIVLLDRQVNGSSKPKPTRAQLDARAARELRRAFPLARTTFGGKMDAAARRNFEKWMDQYDAPSDDGDNGIDWAFMEEPERIEDAVNYFNEMQATGKFESDRRAMLVAGLDGNPRVTISDPDYDPRTISMTYNPRPTKRAARKPKPKASPRTRNPNRDSSVPFDEAMGYGEFAAGGSEADPAPKAGPIPRSDHYKLATRGLLYGPRAGVTNALNKMSPEELQAVYESVNSSYVNAQDMQKIRRLASSVSIIERVAKKRGIRLVHVQAYYGQNSAWDSIDAETKAMIDHLDAGGSHAWMDDPRYDGVEGFIDLDTGKALVVVDNNTGECIVDPEFKTRYVRKPSYWGRPYGTPITPGMRPVGPDADPKA